jgi:tRNA/rRNA methyltransferase/tRNA (cytidine32/uridine32-2'-O)-methyltransferase
MMADRRMGGSADGPSGRDSDLSAYPPIRPSVIVVLHQPQDLLNIAHVVRAMKNFGLRDLRLVDPREYDAHRIEGIAHQSHDVVSRIARFDDLAAALADCVHVAGFTARGRSAKRNVQRPRTAAAEVLDAARGGAVALLFGREDKGLSNEALDRCHRIVTIPTSPAYASLNLAHAVVVMLYELALARGEEDRAFKTPRRPAEAATVEEIERLFADAEQALAAIDFFKIRDREHIMRTVREIVHRVPLDQREAKLLRAMAIEVVKYRERLARSGIHVDRE